MRPAALKVVLAIGSLSGSAGGPSHAVAGAAATLSEAGHLVTIVTQASPGEVELPIPAPVLVSRHPLGSPRAYGPSRTLSREMDRECRSADVLHSFGLWRAVNRYAAKAAKASGKPHVISPTGMLEPQALGRRSGVKRAFWSAWQRRALESAALLHATGPLERESIRLAGISRAPIAVIPNGVTCPNLELLPARGLLDESWPNLSGNRYLLYVGRLHPFKGIDDLLTAFARATRGDSGTRLVLAGPDTGDYTREILKQAGALGIDRSVILTGQVEGQRKWGLLRHAELLILPSRSENFGITIAEALAVETPAIANRNAPWQVLERERCGWWVEPGVEALTDALSKALGESDATRRAMGERGRLYVGCELSWPHVAAMFVAAYEWVAGRAPRPGWVECPA